MTKHKDLDGRDADETIKRIAVDLLEGQRIEITYRNGTDRPIQGVLIRAAPQEFPDLPFTAQLDYYDLQPNELLGDHTIIRSGETTYWRGYE
ncbi:MAG: hypothetical protein FWH27_05985 [Planctomycetaceae bacterium]|nr:hypothetical protein [Planctomycetaceae bacterium]